MKQESMRPERKERAHGANAAAVAQRPARSSGRIFVLQESNKGLSSSRGCPGGVY